MEPVKQHNRDVDHHMYGTWRNLSGLQRARPWEPAFAQRQGCRRHEATYSMELHTCTTGTKTTMSNCNCEISMVRTMGINHCAKTGVSTTVKTATAELRHLSLTNNGHNSNLVRELHHEQEELDHGNCLCATTGMSGQRPHNEVRAHLVQELHLWSLPKQAQ